MAKYLKASYTAEGAKGVFADGGTRRLDATARLAQEMGGSLESVYIAFGETDAYMVVDLPSYVAAAAASIAANGSGAITSEVVVLLMPEEIDEAAKQSVDFRPPGT
ncbi:MAG TPA: GYD domain-containing protein [Gaiellales bacterium]|nr:GYD domain-containing protein [Gaiellales bacterium]